MITDPNRPAPECCLPGHRAGTSESVDEYASSCGRADHVQDRCRNTHFGAEVPDGGAINARPYSQSRKFKPIMG